MKVLAHIRCRECGVEGSFTFMGFRDCVRCGSRDVRFALRIEELLHAKTIVVIKRSMRHGYAGIDNELHTNPKTRMYFTDAKQELSATHVRDQDPRR